MRELAIQAGISPDCVTLRPAAHSIARFHIIPERFPRYSAMNSQGIFRYVRSVALFLLALGLMSARYGSATAQTVSPNRLPYEVMGPNGTVLSLTVTVPPQTTVSAMRLQVNGLGYQNKASIAINRGSWLPLVSTNVVVDEPANSYGGIGGAFNTISLTVPLPANLVTAGSNQVRFRFNFTDGVSIGYRVLAFNFLDAKNNPVLPASAFQWDDPDTWQPPMNDAADIVAGQALWSSAPLRDSTLSNAHPIQARCASCHAWDGRDLKYFNYSNLSIISRANFHGLSTLQGQQIASYIRSLNMPNPGRPWNPPYQPGPALDTQPVTSWAAGAGLDWVLPNDEDTLPYLFPNGITKDAVATTATLNLRELPIAMQLPDWNHWLPRIHPLDAWGTDFYNSQFYKIYNGEGGNNYNINLRGMFTAWKNGTVSLANAASLGPGWSVARDNFLKPKNVSPPPGTRIVWNPTYSQQIYSTAQWQQVKMWEIMEEFGLEEVSSSLFGATGETRTWFTNIAFNVSPHLLKIPDSTSGIGASALTNKYLANAWYEIQAILDNGNRKSDDHTPIDWPYTYDNIKDLNVVSGVPEAMRHVALLVKGMQNVDIGIGPQDSQHGWNPDHKADVSRLIDPNWMPMWSNTPFSVRASVMQVVLGVWFDKTRQYTPQQYYAAGSASPTDVPQLNVYERSFVSQTWNMIPQFRNMGVDGVLLDNVADWAATVWPLPNWASLKGP